MAVAPNAPETVLASTIPFSLSDVRGVYRSIDGGVSWVRASIGAGVVAFDRVTPTRVYLCGNTFSISTDGGASFASGAATGTSCTQFASAGTTIFAAGYPGGTHKSLDGGASWSATGLTTMYTYSVAI